MGIPLDKDWNACLYDWAGIVVKAAIETILDPEESNILDIGAGWGKYGLLLPEYRIDGVEIWEPYLTNPRLDLLNIYDSVYITDAEDYLNLLRPQETYSAIICGDTLEHMPIRKAQNVVRLSVQHSLHTYFVVPWTMHQEEVDGNPYEAHQQEDLTPDVMQQRYPELRLEAQTHNKGLYTTRRSP